MRIVAQIFAALFALLFVALMGLYVVIPRVVGEDFVRKQLSVAVESAIGRGVQFSALGFELFPPSLIAIGAVVGNAAMPLGRADRVELTPALAPLLVGVILIDSASVDGAEIDLVRTSSEIAFADATPIETNKTTQANRVARSDLAVRGLSLSGAKIRLEDRTVDPPLLWTLEKVRAGVFAEAPGAPIRFDLDAELAPGSRLTGNGCVAADGELESEFAFEAVNIATASPYFSADSGVAGWLTGSIRVNGRFDRPAIELTATLRDADLRLGEIALRGTLEIDATVRDVLGAPNGLVELDATAAELGYAGFFSKAPGTPARVVGRVTTDAGGSLAIDAWEFVMQDLDEQVRVEPGNSSRLAGRRPELGSGARKSALGLQECATVLN